MNRTRTWSGLAIVALTCTAAVAQMGRGDFDGRRQPPGGEMLFLTPGLINNGIDRITEKMAQNYGMDEDQMWQTRELMKARFPQWIQDHKSDIISLANQYMEYISGDEPPTPEQVADWAARVQPLANEFMGMVNETTDEMRTYMTEEQQIILDGELAAADIGMNYMNQRFENWKRGGYDWETEWPRGPDFREQERKRVEQLEIERKRARTQVMGTDTALPGGAEAAPGGAAGSPEMAGHEETMIPKVAPSGRPAGPKDEWAAYVDDFIRRYKLTDAQQAQAHKYLDSMQTRRNQYVTRKATVITTVERALKDAKTDEERARLKGQVDEIQETVSRMFKQLKERLDKLPTRAQRSAAAMAKLPSLQSDTTASAESSGSGSESR